MGASITTDNARYQAFLAKFTCGVFTANQIDYLSRLCSEMTQDQSDYVEIKNALTLIMASAYTDTDILTYVFDSITEEEVTVDATAHTVAITVPAGTDASDLTAVFTLSTGANASISGTSQTSGVTANDFSSPVAYTITAQDGSTTQVWTITVTVAAE